MTARLTATLGRLENGEDLVIEFGDGGGHTVIQGQTRSGKSVACYRLLGALAKYQEVVVAGVDPTGILLRAYENAPRPEWRHLGAMDFVAAAEVLGRLTDEMDSRIAGLLTADLDKLDDFTVDHPIVLVVMEEYPSTLAAAKSEDEAEGRKPADRVAPQIARSVKRLVQEGTKVGVRVLILAQRATAETMDGDTRSNCSTRITMRVDNSTAVGLLHEECPPELLAQVRRFAPGVGLVERPAEDILRFRTDLVDYQWYLRTVRNYYQSSPGPSPVSPHGVEQ